MITPHGEHSRLAKAVGVATLFLKREDLHPYGSHKGRSIPFMIERYRSEGTTSFGISSSGNAALAALYHIQNINRDFPDDSLSLSIFIGKHINPEKESLLRKKIVDSKHITITKTDRPKQALAVAVKSGITSLRQSTTNDALVGYFDLARELSFIPHLTTVFVPTSSGTTAEALLQAFKKLRQPVHLHLVQTASCAPIAKVFDNDVKSEEASVADAIVDKIALRKENIVRLLKENHGSAWAVTNEEILHAQLLIRESTGIIASPNGALAVAGLMKAKRHGFHFPGSTACIISGR